VTRGVEKIGGPRKRAWASETGVFNSDFQDATLSLGITRVAGAGGGGWIEYLGQPAMHATVEKLDFAAYRVYNIGQFSEQVECLLFRALFRILWIAAPSSSGRALLSLRLLSYSILATEVRTAGIGGRG